MLIGHHSEKLAVMINLDVLSLYRTAPHIVKEILITGARPYYLRNKVYLRDRISILLGMELISVLGPKISEVVPIEIK